MRRIAVTNQKGGVGKTTTVANLGAALAGHGKRMLLIDLDPQAHLTLHYGVDPAAHDTGVQEVLTDSAQMCDAAIEVRPNVRLVPSHTDLVAAEAELIGVVGREVILRDALAAVSDEYDILLIDCPPSLGVLSLNALAAVDEVIIPLQPHFLALQGLAKLLETVSLVQARINAGLRVSGVVLCLHETGTRLANEVIENLQEFLEGARGGDAPWSAARLFESSIRRNIKLAECPSHGSTIFDYAPKSRGAEDYSRLAKEVLGEPLEIEETPIEPASPEAPEETGPTVTAALEPAPTEPHSEPASMTTDAPPRSPDPVEAAPRPTPTPVL